MSRQPAKPSGYVNGYTAKDDALVAAHPPQITWRKGKHGIWVHVKVIESPRVQTTPTPRTPRATRSQRCKSGHLLTEDNTYITPAGYRKCRVCRAAEVERRRSKSRRVAEIASTLQQAARDI